MKYIKLFEEYTLKNNDKLLYNKYTTKVIQSDDKIIKIFDYETDEYKNIVKYFTLDDNIFPKIYKIDNLEITMELLDVKKSEKEYNKLNKYLKEKYKISAYKILFNDYYPYANKEEKIDESKIILSKDLEIIYNKFKVLIDKIMKIVGKHFLLDIHSNNFGYDKEGNLKMFDI